MTVSTMDVTDSETCNENALYAYDGNSHNATLIGAYCGRRTHLPIVSQGNVLFIELDQNHYNTIEFWATYSSSTSACGGVLKGEQGSFASPGYPKSYPTNSECVWSLQAASGKKK